MLLPILIIFTTPFIGAAISIYAHRLILSQNDDAERQWAEHTNNPLPSYPPITTLPVSTCAYCNQHLPVLHRIPLIGTLKHLTTCAPPEGANSAKTKFRIELLFTLSAPTIAYFYGYSFSTGAFLLFITITATLVLADLEYQLLPDQINYALLWSGLAISLAPFSPVTPRDAILGAITGYGIFWLVGTTSSLIRRGSIGLGRGDYKLLAAFGAWTGAQHLPRLIIIAAALAVIQLLYRRATRPANTQKQPVPIPFAPALAISAIYVVFLSGALPR